MQQTNKNMEHQKHSKHGIHYDQFCASSTFISRCDDEV